jgi:hypothetical protein
MAGATHPRCPDGNSAPARALKFGFREPTLAFDLEKQLACRHILVESHSGSSGLGEKCGQVYLVPKN